MNEDLKTALDSSREDEPIYTYQYTEKDSEERTNKIAKKLEKNEEEGEEVIAKQITEGDLKKQNKTLLILGAIFTGLVLITTALVILLPKIMDEPDLTVPDVKGLTILEAEKKLKAVGFEIADESKQVFDKDIEAGLVVKTSPVGGSTRTKGTKITIYESLGDNSITIEDYTGQNYIAIQARLEVYKINVIVEKEDVEDATLYDEGEIISQTPKEGTSLSEGDTVTLRIPNIITKYPDFTNGEYSREDIEAFCAEYNIALTVEEVESETTSEGTIIYQSRPADSIIPSSGGKLIIRVVVAPGSEEDPIEGLLE